MSALIIFCHPCKKSLNFFLKSLIKEKLEKELFEVRETDVYENLDSVSNGDESFFLQEREKIRLAELIVLQFPVYFENFPALLQMFWLRVLNDFSLLNGKKILVSCTLGGRREDYVEGGVRDSLESSLGRVFGIVFGDGELLQPLCVFKDEYTNNEVLPHKLQLISSWLEKISEWPVKYRNIELGLEEI